MSEYTLRETFWVDQYDFDQQEKTKLNNPNYFEILFINKGSGYCATDKDKLAYKESNIFISGPENTCFFEAKKHTLCTGFRFTKSLFLSKVNLSDRNYWLQCIEQVLHHPNTNNRDIIFHEKDRNTIWDIYHIILDEFENKKSYHQEIISNALNMILSIIVRNVSEKYSSNPKKATIYHSKIDKIINHIRQHIYDNDLTKINYLANKFNMSSSSISTYFKKKTGQSIHQYVTTYKMKLVEYRLHNTEFTISEIAQQLGYTDESHLTKTFKKHFLMSPKQYRKQATSNV